MGMLGLCYRGRDRRGGFHGGDLFLTIGLLGLAELLFHLHLEFVGSTAELTHPLADLSGQDRQFLRPKEQKREDK